LSEPSTSSAPYRVCNIGRNEPVSLGAFIEAIEEATGMSAIRNNMPIQPGDVQQTYADVEQLKKLTGYSPNVNIKEGVNRFVKWYLLYMKNR